MQYCDVITNPRWRTATILKTAKSPYFSEKIIQFWWNLVHNSRYWTRWQSRNQKLKFLEFKIQDFRIQDGGGHLENRFFGYNSSTDCPISAKFCTRKQNGMPAKDMWQKLQIFKMPDGGQPPLWKSPYLSEKITRFWWHLVYYSRYWTWWQSHDQKLKFLKFKMANGCHLRNRFST